jgi:hypothetical protein
MLERNIQPPTEQRVRVEEAAHAHRCLRRTVWPGCVFEYDREPLLSRRIPVALNTQASLETGSLGRCSSVG